MFTSVPMNGDLTRRGRTSGDRRLSEIRARTGDGAASQPEQVLYLHEDLRIRAGMFPDDPLVFETERAVIAFTARLMGVQVFDGFAHTDVTVENTEATAGFQPFGPLAKEESALMLGFAYAAGSPLVEFPARTELDLAFWTTTPPISTGLASSMK